MWSISRNRPLGTLSGRRRTLFLLVTIMALFVTPLFPTIPVAAQTTDAAPTRYTGGGEWSGDVIRYGQWTRTGEDGRWSLSKQSQSASTPDISSTVCANKRHIYYSAVAWPTSGNGVGESAPTALVLCLDAESEAIDKTSALPAQIIVFTGSEGQNIKDFRPSTPTRLQVYPEGTNPDIQQTIEDIVSDTETTESITTCDSKNTHGLGWIICPVTNWLASTMDLLYKALSSFLIVAPLSTDRDNVMYYVWDLMRNLANILFIVGFLVIIYSQTTSFGISNYGLKRLLPRLIIAAVLVNISYWVAAIAVDLSNLLGMSFKAAFEVTIENIPKAAGQTYDFREMNWTTLAGSFLSGSAAIFVSVTAIAGIVASAGGSLWFLLVGLAGVILSGLVAILVMAARQALITILIILSPLAFVAYLLPSTEKYFDKWKDLFLTMLLVYPIFSIVFGGAQLAGLAIMQSAPPASPNFFNLIVLGMIVQVAPVIITPLLIKLSGSLLGRIAGMVNNPNRGLVDQTRKFAQTRSDMTKNSQMWQKNKDGSYTHNNPLAWGARRVALREADRSHRMKAYEGGLEAAYEQDQRSHAAYGQSAINEMMKSEGENTAKAAFAREVRNNELLRRLYYSKESSGETAETEAKYNKTEFEGLKADPSTEARGDEELRIGELARANDIVMRDLAYRQDAAKRVQEAKSHEELATDTLRQQFAGYSTIDEHGLQRIANIAETKESEARTARVNAAMTTLDKREPTLTTERAIIVGDVTGSGEFARMATDTDSRSGALRRYVSRAPIEDLQTLLEDIDMSSDANANEANATLRSELMAAIAKRGPVYVSAKDRTMAVEGKLSPAEFKGINATNTMIKKFIESGGFDAKAMATSDRDDVRRIYQYIHEFGVSATAKKKIREQLILAYDPEGEWAGQLGKRDLSPGELGAIWTEMGLDPNKQDYIKRYKERRI